MGAVELFLEHRHRDRFLRSMRFRSSEKTYLIGSSTNADIRIIGPEVSPFHAVLECREGQWVIFDFGSTSGTWIDGESIDERIVTDKAVVQIGQNRLQLKVTTTGRPLFVAESENVDATDAPRETMHQVVIKQKGRVVRADLLAPNERYHSSFKGQTILLEAPTQFRWVTHKIGDLEVRHRLIQRPDKMISPGIEIDPSFRKPLSIASGAFALLLLLALVLPSTGPDLNYEEPIDRNMSELIYNAKVIQKKRLESDKLTVVQKAQTRPPEVQSAVATPTQEPASGGVASPAVSKTITKIRASGLDQLIGKIAKRASETSLKIATSGVSPDQAVGPSRLGAVGRTSEVIGDGKMTDTKSAQIGAVGTAGKAGASTSYRQGTGLSAGSVGTGEVGLVEEEGVVEGGLDRDIIAEIIRRDIGQIRFCYERQLSAQPELYGKVLVKFEINPEGAVEAPRVGTTTLNNASVEGCILRRVAKWRFPAPKGGTAVLVSYPFLFKTTE